MNATEAGIESVETAPFCMLDTAFVPTASATCCVRIGRLPSDPTCVRGAVGCTVTVAADRSTGDDGVADEIADEVADGVADGIADGIMDEGADGVAEGVADDVSAEGVVGAVGLPVIGPTIRSVPLITTLS